jgi:hypothetical protein
MSGEAALPVADVLGDYTQRFVTLIREGKLFAGAFFVVAPSFFCGLHRVARLSRTGALGAKRGAKQGTGARATSVASRDAQWTLFVLLTV